MKKAKQLKRYSAPFVQIVEFQSAEVILGLSGGNAALSGAGVDEEEANDNGNSIW